MTREQVAKSKGRFMVKRKPVVNRPAADLDPDVCFFIGRQGPARQKLDKRKLW